MVGVLFLHSQHTHLFSVVPFDFQLAGITFCAWLKFVTVAALVRLPDDTSF